MDTTHSSLGTRIKVGIFTLIGFILIGIVTVVSSAKPLWWANCQMVKINVEDATGLKTKSPIRSLGIEIGYLKSIALTESHVTLGICLTAPVEVLTTTRAYLRGEGFLGDKFVELKPVRYMSATGREPSGKADPVDPTSDGVPSKVPPAQPDHRSESQSESQEAKSYPLTSILKWISSWVPDAQAAEGESPRKTGRSSSKKSESEGGKEIPVGEQGQDVQKLVGRVDELVGQMTQLTDNLKKAINPEDLRATMRQLNITLSSANKTIAPEGGLNQTAQRSLAKLEDAIEQLRDMVTRVNRGEGSVGMLLNDPTYADEIRQVIKNVNKLLNRVTDVRFNVDLGSIYLTQYSKGRGWFQLGIWPNPRRYYLLGLAIDPRGRASTVVTNSKVGTSNLPQQQVQSIEQTAVLFTAMVGKVWEKRYDFSVGVLYNDGTVSANVLLGPTGNESMFQIRNDLYVRNTGSIADSSSIGVDDRLTLTAVPYAGAYIRAGIESFQGHPDTKQIVYFVGAGLSFDDDDIKLLFALR